MERARPQPDSDARHGREVLANLHGAIVSVLRAGGPLAAHEVAALVRIETSRVGRVLEHLSQRGMVRQRGAGNSAGGPDPVTLWVAAPDAN